MIRHIVTWSLLPAEDAAGREARERRAQGRTDRVERFDEIAVAAHAASRFLKNKRRFSYSFEICW